MINGKFSAVEKVFNERSFHLGYQPDDEKITTIIVNSFPEMGKLTALRFIEWVQSNPGGVISLPTGKTPEHFIAWVKRILQHWNTSEIQNLLTVSGLNASLVPDMKSLKFVQIDDFYPMDGLQGNSFYSYVKKFYIEGFGLDLEKALLMPTHELGLVSGQTLRSVWPEMKVDLSLRLRAAKTSFELEQQATLHRIDQWCQEYEEKIQALGGIGFFLGGIGPDGHIGFNIRGSDHHSTTRLLQTNYETQAAAAGDLGGIETSRDCHVISIGLKTITNNPDAVVIIMAAGEAKSKVVCDAILNEANVLYPATALHKCEGARFYLTMGAAKDLPKRNIHLIQKKSVVTEEDMVKAMVNCSLHHRKSISELNTSDVDVYPEAAVILSKQGKSLDELKREVIQTLVARIEKGSESIRDTTFLHTEPHHDDIMLGYFTAVVRAIRDASNEHHFVTLTSGFTAVTNVHLLNMINQLEHYFSSKDYQSCLEQTDYFSPKNQLAKNRDIWQYLDGIAARNSEIQRHGSSRRFLRNLIDLYAEKDLVKISARIESIKLYLAQSYPGKKDPCDIQKLKGMCREWEAECVWGYFGWNSDHIHHLRLGFYSGDLFTEEPTVNRDIPPVVDLVRKVNPKIITVALDPEGSGPDTHYKVLQAVAASLKSIESELPKDLRVWGYRNVWYRFHPSESNRYVPVSLNMFSAMNESFMNNFITQKYASFPSYEHDGPFCELAQQIQVEQYQMLKICLGRAWFYEHPSPLIRATKGLIFLKEMDFETFKDCSRELRKQTENVAE